MEYFSTRKQAQKRAKEIKRTKEHTRPMQVKPYKRKRKILSRKKPYGLKFRLKKK